MTDFIPIRPMAQIAKCRRCGSRNVTMHQGWVAHRWTNWFHCNACDHDTPARELRDEAVEDVLWVPFGRQREA